jgi:hypothetical protein
MQSCQALTASLVVDGLQWAGSQCASPCPFTTPQHILVLPCKCDMRRLLPCSYLVQLAGCLGLRFCETAGLEVCSGPAGHAQSRGLLSLRKRVRIFI